MFIASMTTYRPLLLRIQQAYDAALGDAAGSAYDHVHLQTELSLMPQRHVSVCSTCPASCSSCVVSVVCSSKHVLHFSFWTSGSDA
jgi:hypothetical protein